MKKKGFTLTELLAVILILGLVLLVVTNTVTSSSQNTKVSLKNSKVKTILSKMSEYGNEKINEYSICQGDDATNEKNSNICVYDMKRIIDEVKIDTDTLTDPTSNTLFNGKVLMCYNARTLEVVPKYSDGNGVKCNQYDPLGKQMLSISEASGTYYIGGSKKSINFTADGYRTTDEGGEDTIVCSTNYDYLTCKISIQNDSRNEQPQYRIKHSNDDNYLYNGNMIITPKKGTSASVSIPNDNIDVTVTLSATSKRNKRTLSMKYTAHVYKSSINWKNVIFTSNPECVAKNTPIELEYETTYSGNVTSKFYRGDNEIDALNLNSKLTNNKISFNTTSTGALKVELTEDNGNQKVSKDYNVYDLAVLDDTGTDQSVLLVKKNQTKTFTIVADSVIPVLSIDGLDNVIKDDLCIEDNNIKKCTNGNLSYEYDKKAKTIKIANNIAEFSYNENTKELKVTGRENGETSFTISGQNNCGFIKKSVNVTELSLSENNITVYAGGTLNASTSITSSNNVVCEKENYDLFTCSVKGKFLHLTPKDRQTYDTYLVNHNIKYGSDIKIPIKLIEPDTGSYIITEINVVKTDLQLVDANNNPVNKICRDKKSIIEGSKDLFYTNNDSTFTTTLNNITNRINSDPKNVDKTIYTVKSGEDTVYLKLLFNGKESYEDNSNNIFQYNNEGWYAAYDTIPVLDKYNKYAPPRYKLELLRRYNYESMQDTASGMVDISKGFISGNSEITYQENWGNAQAKLNYTIYDIDSKDGLNLGNLMVGDTKSIVIKGSYTGTLTLGDTSRYKEYINVSFSTDNNISQPYKLEPNSAENNGGYNHYDNGIIVTIEALKTYRGRITIPIIGSECGQSNITISQIKEANTSAKIVVVNHPNESGISQSSCNIGAWGIACQAELPGTFGPVPNGYSLTPEWYERLNGKFTPYNDSKIYLYRDNKKEYWAVYRDTSDPVCTFDGLEKISITNSSVKFTCTDNSLLSLSNTDKNNIFSVNGIPITDRDVNYTGQNTNKLVFSLYFDINKLNTSNFTIDADLSKIYSYSQVTDDLPYNEDDLKQLGFSNKYMSGKVTSNMIIVDKYGKGVKTKIGDNAYMFVYPDTNNDRNIYIMGSGDLYDYTEDEYVYPEKYNLSNADTIYIDEGITSIGSYIFKNLGTNKHHVKINLPSTLESISENAFVNSYIDIINTENTLLTEIGDYVFNNAHINELIISDQIESIGSNVFNGTDINALTLPSTINKLDDNAFNSSLIKELTINSSEIEFGKNVFVDSSIETLNLNNLTSDINGQILKGMDNLKSITVSSDNPKYEVINNILYTKDLSKVLLIPSDYQNQEIYINENATTLEKFAFRRTVLKDEIEKEYGDEDSTIFNGYILNINNITNLNIWYLDEEDDYIYSNFENIKIEKLVVSYDNQVYELKDMQIGNDTSDDEEAEYEQVLYRKADNSIVLVPSYSEEKRDVLVINDIDYKIDAYAMYNNRKYENVYLRGTINKIGAYALYNSNKDYMNYVSLDAEYDEDADIIGENALCIKPYDDDKEATIGISSESKRDKLITTGEYSYVAFIFDE